MKSLRYGLLAIGLSSQLGCAHAQQAGVQAPANQESSMSASNDEQIHTLQEYPELTPEGMGRRFLKYLDNLHTKEQLNPEFLEQQMGVKLAPGPESAHFSVRLPDSERQYAVVYYEDRATPPNKSVVLWFSTGLTEEEWNMTPVCAMDFDDFKDGLEQIGYLDTGLANYDHGPPVHNEQGERTGYAFWNRRPEFFYSRNNIFVTVYVRGESVDNPEHLCVTSIEINA